MGTRTVRASLEHRWYAVDDVFGLLGLGLAAFADYGGAWHEGQDLRLGGNLGVGLLVGSPRSPFPRVAQVALGRRFGGGLPRAAALPQGVPSRWALTVITAPTF